MVNWVNIRENCVKSALKITKRIFFFLVLNNNEKFSENLIKIDKKRRKVVRNCKKMLKNK